jgi:hypothetical protein
MSRQVILLLTHSTEDRHHVEFERINNSLKNHSDVFMLFHAMGEKRPTFSGTIYPFTNESLGDLGYPMFADSVVPGSTHFPVLEFIRNFPKYDFCWVIEYDVHFNGKWRSFFNHFQESSADFITSHIRSFSEEPKWFWWGLQHPGQHVPLSERLRSFNPIYRISRRALMHIDRLHSEQWSGHYEEFLVTMLHRGGFSLQDFGGRGPFVEKGDKNRFYIDHSKDKRGRMDKGTMRFRPSFSKVGWRRNKLYHPVKGSEDAFLLDNPIKQTTNTNNV